MTVEGLGWTNFWLGMLVIASLTEFMIIAGIGLLAYLMYRRAMAVIATVERQHIAPLHARVDAILDEAQEVIARGRDMVGRSKAWPVVGIARGLRVAINAMRNRRSTETERHDASRSGAAQTQRRYP